MMLRSWSGIGRTKRRTCCFGFRFRSGQRSGEFARTRLDEWGRTVFVIKHEADKMLGKEEDTE